MVFSFGSGSISEKHIRNELVVEGYSEFDYNTVYSTHADSDLYHTGPRVVFVFYRNYMRVFSHSEEITGQFYRMWFLNAITELEKNVYDSYRIPMIQHTAGTSSLAASNHELSGNVTGANVYTSAACINLEAVRQFKEILCSLGRINGINLSKFGLNEDELSITEIMYLYCFPLFRNVFQKNMCFNNLDRLFEANTQSYPYVHMGNQDEHIGGAVIFNSNPTPREREVFLDFLFCEDLKEGFEKCLNGLFHKKLFKEVLKEFKVNDVNKILKVSILNLGEKKRAVEYHEAEGFELKKSIEDTLHFNKKQINIKFFGLMSFIKVLSQIKDIKIDHIHSIMMFHLEKQSELLSSITSIYPMISISSYYLGESFFITKKYCTKRIVKLFCEDFCFYEIRDTSNQFYKYFDPEEIPFKLREKYPNGIPLPKKPKTWKEVHDKISACYNEIKAEEKNVPFEYESDLFNLHLAEKDGIRLKLPSSGSKIVEWGQEMKHCIASYIEKHCNGQYILFGVYEKDCLMYNSRFTKEGSKWILAECRGLSNKDAPKDIKKIVSELVEPYINTMQESKEKKKSFIKEYKFQYEGRQKKSVL